MTVTTEELTDWIENSNDGDGPAPVFSVERADLDALLAARRERDRAEDDLAHAVAAVHAAGASWALIGAALGMTRQGAHRKYAGANL